MKTIKIANGVRVIVDGESFDYGDGKDEFDAMCKDIMIPDELKDDLFLQLFMNWRIDLSNAYREHSVIVELIPAEDEDEEDEESED